MLTQLTQAELLTCADPELAAHQFLGLIQEFLIWPRVTAIGPPIAALPASDMVIDEALLTFLSRYRPRPDAPAATEQ